MTITMMPRTIDQVAQVLAELAAFLRLGVLPLRPQPVDLARLDDRNNPERRGSRITSPKWTTPNCYWAQSGLGVAAGG